ncbi:MAG: hypothetical protein A3J74_09490 [Elusimicrobia bacterium RIFCSPHIGHO2_02_FULL_57_9]|nr:MAG: hypothetical protein A3J74_09490 [Elusimicrobia bacterium RIFCSPHIGHO2_02_FULL_57_9]
MSMASHDLSNSLMTLQVSFEMLLTTISLNDEQEKRVAYISNGIGQISRLIDDLVDWASIEQGKLRLETAMFAPGAMVEEISMGPQARAQARGIALKADIEPNLPEIRADKKRIAQVLNNLLENAIRHTLKGGEITIILRRLPVDGNKQEIQLAVRDTGEGIAPDELERIFRSFYQGKTSATGGRLGLGLSIAKEIVEAHKWRLWVESPGVGQGATFLFTIPVPARLEAAGYGKKK